MRAYKVDTHWFDTAGAAIRYAADLRRPTVVFCRNDATGRLWACFNVLGANVQHAALSSFG